eukprot:CAMPEP_0118665276 /NCGR_PEP_ID=MMETSP0785-20121206/18528_1 /TAXON_ID=91992 /ORGANISM="Bolidomonas pacifica, Strain CCMP 1866" /LENGTH=1102 /DNA_ID=CAMNT_0006559375 /DNA_START=139 /DNA_END=3444 /DNA_ORIENTATION=-
MAFSFLASLNPLTLLLVVLILLPHSVRGTASEIFYRNDGTCQGTDNFFDNLGVKCQTCDTAGNQVPDTSELDPYSNPFGCTCNTGYSKIYDASTSDSDWDFTCTDTCSVKGWSVATDGVTCAKCEPGDSANNLYDTTSKDCQCTQPGTTDADGAVITYKLVEKYNTTDSAEYSTYKECELCPTGTAVIETATTTAGVSYTPDRYVCASCPDENMYFDASFVCQCPTGMQKVGRETEGTQKCVINNMNAETDVEFYAIETEPYSGIATGTDTVASDAMSHYFDYAYYKCAKAAVAFLTKDVQEACQTLANLCVMNMYDEDHDTCDYYDTIKNTRLIEYYNDIDGWKEALPWITYKEAPKTIRENRGIEMQVSFEELTGYTHKLRYKLFKYALNGTFVGVEDLGTQFTYCGMATPNTEYGGGDTSSTKFLKFGTGQKTVYQCDLEVLALEEMFFYDMYVVDEGNTDCVGSGQVASEGDCLYPVPILIRNLRLNAAFPNANQEPEEEIDDVFVRRFFLHDNESGKKDGDLEILRYAKKMTLGVMITPEDPSKIFSPILEIEYQERKTGSWADRKRDGNPTFNEEAELMAISTMTFKSEYHMDTTEFWSNIEILVGFVTAIAGVVWLTRVRNWQTRNQRLGSTSPDTGESMGTVYMLHVLMLLLHTFVMIFFPFVFMICSYWFVFFKLQATVFVLMPADNEYYMVGNEYFFYETMFHVLFWTHTAYMFYTIYLQCNTDIFFVDWEKPKSVKQDVSIWRTILVANEWNEMQTKRKTSIEMSLAWIGFFLIGLDLKNNATNQPNLEDVTDGHINIALRFCNTTWWFFVTFAIQWIWNFFFYERYYREPRSQIFVDLCTIAKVSVFIMDEPYHGYYLHCRSPYEFADGSMQQLAEQLKKEESGLTTDRRLDAPGAPEDCQTFELFTSPIFRQQFDKVYTALNQNNSAALAQDTGRLGHMVGRAGGKGRDPPPERMVMALKELNSFLQSFVEQSPPPQREELKRIVREQPFLDQVIGTPPADIRASNAKCVFYPDTKTWLKDHNFLNVTFLGIEPDLFIHNILTFNLFDMGFNDPAISILGTYLMHILFVWLRGSFGQGNLASKTLVDDR